jgi:hypothetical protein
MNVYEEAAEQSLGAISDPELRIGVGRLFADTQRMIEERGINLVVLTARRLACLYQLLIQTGMPPIEGSMVVSDRFLDANPNLEWTSARVLLLDDSVVVGTTLVRLRDYISGKGARAVLCRSVCIDFEQSAEYLLEGADFEALYVKTSNEVQQFSRDVVVALFQQQVPFFSDFPISRPVDISVKAWKGYLENPDWHVADVTAPLLSDTVQTFAQVPTQETTQRFLSRVTPEASALLDNFKMRSYVRKSNRGVLVVFVPIAMLAPCKPSALDSALSAIAVSLKSANAEFGMDWQSWTPVAKHRLVQIYLSACVLAELWPNIASAASLDDSTLTTNALEPLPISLYFGDRSEAALAAFNVMGGVYRSTEVGTFDQPAQIRLDQPEPSRLLRELDVQDVLWEVHELLAQTGYPEQPSQGELTKIGLIFAHGVSSIFGFLNRVYELPQRAEIRALRSRAEYYELFSDDEKRFLNQGFTMRELTAALAPDHMTGSPWARSLLSLGIDTGNDLGIIVPVTRHDVVRDIVHRSYRLGETAQLAEWPLPEAIRTDQLDALSSTVLEGFPILTSTEQIPRYWRRRHHHMSDTSALRLAVLDAVPGNIVSRFNGWVTSVEGETFDAELISSLEDDHRLAQMRSAQLTDATRKHLEPGVTFTWTVFSRERSGVKDNISRIRVRRPEPLDTERLYRGAHALAYLAGVDDEPPIRG